MSLRQLNPANWGFSGAIPRILNGGMVGNVVWDAVCGLFDLEISMQRWELMFQRQTPLRVIRSVVMSFGLSSVSW